MKPLVCLLAILLQNDGMWRNVFLFSIGLTNNLMNVLTHWGRATHVCVGKLTIIGSDNGLSPERRQAIIWTNAVILLIGPLGTNSSDFLIGIHTFSLKKMHWKMSSAKWRSFCLGLNVLNRGQQIKSELEESTHWWLLTLHGTKPLPGSLLTSRQWVQWHFPVGNFGWRIQHVANINLKLQPCQLTGQWVKTHHCHVVLRMHSFVLYGYTATKAPCHLRRPFYTCI